MPQKSKDHDVFVPRIGRKRGEIALNCTAFEEYQPAMNRPRYVLLATIALLFCLGFSRQYPIQATPLDSPAAPGIVGQTGGSDSPALAVVGTMAYVGVGPRLVAIDVSNPYAPGWVGQSPLLPYVVQDVAVSSGLAYVVTGSSGLHILDVTNPQDIRLRASLDGFGFAKAVHVANGLAYVADFGTGLALVDVHNPDAPVLRGRYPTHGGPHAVDVAGTLAYVADDSSGLLVIETANPANPVLRGALKSAGVALDVEVAGTIAYMAYFNQGLRTIDVSSPANPQRLGRIDTPGLARAVQVSGSTAYVADGDRLLAIDVTNPAFPVVAASSRIVASSVAAAGNRVYVTDRRQLHIFDTSDPATLLRRSTTPFVGAAQAVAVSASLGYVASRTDGFAVFDLGDLTRPQRLSTLPAAGPLLDVTVTGSRAIAVGPSGLQIVDVSQPALPVRRGSLALPGLARKVAVTGNLAVVAAGWGGVHIVDFTNPQAPVRRATYTSETAMGVDVAGSLAFVAAGKTLLVLDITNPAAPVLRSTTLLPGWGVDVAVQGNHAYVADAEDGLLVLDVSNPAAPLLRGTLPTTHAVGVTVSGSYASVADSHGGVVMVDVSNPVQPVRVAAFDTPGLARGVAGLGQQLVVADDYGGLAIWSPAGGVPPTPTMTPSPSMTPSATPTLTPTPTATPTVTPTPVRRFFPHVTRSG